MKLYYSLLVSLYLILVVNTANAQPDTIIVYTISTQTIDTILPVSFNPNITFDNTNSSIGSLGNQTTLNLISPTTNLFSNSNFSDVARAELFFNLTDYPVRTATRLFYYNNGIMSGYCSGMMVSKDFVLTAGHCAYSYFNQAWEYDSILVAPAYNNGILQPLLPYSMVEKVYIFKTFYDSNNFDDIALLQLRQPIGQQTGWVGMAFSSDTSYFTGKVFHKLSYPSIASPFDSTKVYNGDTLYYNYGFINKLPPTSLGINSPQALGIPGQSGSSFFYTNNTDYYLFAVFSFSSLYRHYQIDQNVFYQFENIITNYATNTPDVVFDENIIEIYPNPFNTTTTLQLSRNEGKANLILINMYGEQVKRIENISGQVITLNREDLPCGVYFIHLTQNNIVTTTAKIIIAD
jgi:Secretion system C-terminal sorting domain/Trypsin